MNKISAKALNQALEHIVQLPAKKRLEAILEHEKPSKLLNLMHPQDILLTIREVGGQDALELFELLKPAQVQEILDLEVWKNDDVDLNKMGYYFSLLFAANVDKAALQLDGLDVELVGLMFKLVSHIYDTTLGEEPIELGGLVSQSPDGRFIICFAEDHERAALSRALCEYLESLYARDMKRALSLLEKLRFELSSILESASYIWRTNRLLDRGILPAEERLEYFSPLNLGALNKNKNNMPEINNNNLLPMIKTNIINNTYIFLKRAIEESSAEEQDIYFQALTHASRNMHASLSGDFGDREALIKTAEYIKALCEFGLAQATNAQLEQSVYVLRNYGIKTLIRLGRTALINLRKLLMTNDLNFLFGENFALADSPLREVARALKLGEPRYYEGLLDSNKFDLRFFNSLLELNATLKAVHELRFRAELLGPRVLAVNLDQLELNNTLSHAGIFARILVNTYLKKDQVLNIISREELKKLNMHDFNSWAKIFVDDLAYKLAEHGSYDLAKAKERCANFLSAVLAQLEQNPELLLR